MNPITEHYYTTHADPLAACYDLMDTEGVHGAWLPHVLPHLAPGSTVLDVGCGSGRDARWFVEQGHNVLGIEPCAALRAHADVASAYLDPERIFFADCELPGLPYVCSDFAHLVLLSAVWQHVEAPAAALARLWEVTRPGGFVVLTLRHGPGVEGRGDVDIDVAHTTQLAVAQGFTVSHFGAGGLDMRQRSQVTWSVLVLRRPA